jgi:hypothetical protein
MDGFIQSDNKSAEYRQRSHAPKRYYHDWPRVNSSRPKIHTQTPTAR